MPSADRQPLKVLQLQDTDRSEFISRVLKPSMVFGKTLMKFGSQFVPIHFLKQCSIVNTPTVQFFTCLCRGLPLWLDYRLPLFTEPPVARNDEPKKTFSAFSQVQNRAKGVCKIEKSGKKGYMHSSQKASHSTSLQRVQNTAANRMSNQQHAHSNTLTCWSCAAISSKMYNH